MMEERGRSALPLSFRRPVFGALGHLYPKADWAPRPLRAKTTLQAMAFDSVQAYLHSVSIMRHDERESLYSDSFKNTLAGYSALNVFRSHADKSGTDDPLALIQYIDYKTWLVGDINTKVDRASMAHSLEVREPLMDHELIEWLATLPTDLKIRGQEGKWLLKKAFEPHLPHDILYRPKMGFSVPLAQWLRGPLAERLKNAITGPRLAESGYFNPARLRSMLEKHQSGQRDFSAPLWSLLMFDAFLKNADL
jgi:asparagine synthase (glutamine-hydrolysing)